MLISVIIPNYNHSLFLEERIQTVLNQTYKNIEVILLDDCSSDNSRAIIESYKSHPLVKHTVLNERNSGSTFNQWQKGIELAKGDWLWIAESDDLSDKYFLDKSVSAIKTHKDVSLAFCNSVVIDENGSHLFPIKELNPFLDKAAFDFEKSSIFVGSEFVRRFMVHENLLMNASSILVKNDFYDYLKTIREKGFVISGDWFLWISYLLDKKLFYVADALNYYRIHLNNVRTANRINSVIEYLAVLRLLLDRGVIQQKDIECLFLDKFANYCKGIPVQKLDIQDVNNALLRAYSAHFIWDKLFVKKIRNELSMLCERKILEEKPRKEEVYYFFKYRDFTLIRKLWFLFKIYVARGLF